MVFLEWTWYEWDGELRPSDCGITDVYVSEYHVWLLLAFKRGRYTYRFYKETELAIKQTFQEI